MKSDVENIRIIPVSGLDLNKKFYLLNTIGWLTVLLIDTFIVTPKINLQNIQAFLLVLYGWTSGYMVSLLLHFVYDKMKFFHIKSILLLL